MKDCFRTGRLKPDASGFQTAFEMIRPFGFIMV